MKTYIIPITESQNIHQTVAICTSPAYADPNDQGGGGDTNKGQVF